MIFCDRTDCQLNNGAACVREDAILDEDGTCTGFVQDFDHYWNGLDDIEKEEYNNLMNGEEK